MGMPWTPDKRQNKVQCRLIFATGECYAGAKNGRNLTVSTRAGSKRRLMDYPDLNYKKAI